MGSVGLFEYSLFSTDSENPDTPALPIRIKTMARPKKDAKKEVKKDLAEATEQALEASVSDEISEVDEVAKDEEVEAQEDSKVEQSIDESPEKKAFRAKVEAYKLSNPAKYELKKSSFEATLKGMN